MPWLEATPMEQRERFIRDHAGGLYTMTELCARHTISRKTGYKWLERFDEGGRAALGDRSRAPLRLGIQHQRILPGQPQQNGAHERMHKTLKAEAIRPPRATLVAQQRAFNRFRMEYNEERPHEYLRGATPASRYQPSARSYDARLPPIEYPGHFLVKRITNAGTFRFKRRLLFISHALAPNTIGLEEVDDGVWSIYFCDVLIARLDERDLIIRS